MANQISNESGSKTFCRNVSCLILAADNYGTEFKKYNSLELYRYPLKIIVLFPYFITDVVALHSLTGLIVHFSQVTTVLFSCDKVTAACASKIKLYDE